MKVDALGRCASVHPMRLAWIFDFHDIIYPPYLPESSDDGSLNLRVSRLKI